MDAVPVPSPIHIRFAPTPPACLRRLHQPRSASTGETDPPNASMPTWPHRDPECWPDAPPLSTAILWCLLLCAAFFRTPLSEHHSHEAPFFSGLDRLAVYDGSTGTGIPPLSQTQPLTEHFMNPFHGPVSPPSAEVVEGGPPRGEVVREHSPCASGAQHITNSVHHLPARVFERAASWFRRRQQRFQQFPFFVAQVAWITLSSHGTLL